MSSVISGLEILGTKYVPNTRLTKVAKLMTKGVLLQEFELHSPQSVKNRNVA